MSIQKLMNSIACLGGLATCAALVLSAALPNVTAASGGGASASPRSLVIVTRPSPPEEDLVGLDAFVESAYAVSSAASGLDLSGTVVSPMLPTADHYFRISQRLRPGFDGFYTANEAAGGLDYRPWEYFQDNGYDPHAPLRALAIVEVSGLLDGRPIDYEAFVFRFEEADGSCWIDLMDPVFPDVNSFADDASLGDTFPNCDGPNAVAARMIEAAVPGIPLLGFEHGVAVLEDTPSAGLSTNARGSIDPGVGNCTSGSWNKNYKLSTSNVCSDVFGGGVWIRGGSYSQHVTCVAHGDSCQVQGVGSTDDLHSSIRPKGSLDCDCCDDFGATVTGNTASATLFSQLGLTGGHVAIAKAMVAYRTSNGQNMSALSLGGQCGGVLDLPYHGASADANGHFDYQSSSETIQNAAQIGAWNAENIQVHICAGRPIVKKAITFDSKIESHH